MRTADYRLTRETYEEQSAAGRYNPANVLIHDGKRYTIGAGDSDHVDAYTDAGLLFVVSLNSGLDYVGLEVFDTTTGEQIGNTFMQNEEDWREALGPRGLDLHPRTIAKRLADYAIQ